MNEREDEVAVDLVHHMSRVEHPPASARGGLSASGSGGGGGVPLLLPALAILAALAIAAAAGGRPRRSAAFQPANQATHPRRYR
ncbi:MAG: hypothetical protein ACTHKT_10705 [Solirubrobacterales bacterium]